MMTENLKNCKKKESCCYCLLCCYCCDLNKNPFRYRIIKDDTPH